jgi:hypothetical protein
MNPALAGSTFGASTAAELPSAWGATAGAFS